MRFLVRQLKMLRKNVAKAIALDIPHLSLYSLILEHHTVFMNKMRRGKIEFAPRRP